jgi:hypothetical protein
MLPFTSTQFFDIFGAYNISIWPMQAVVYGLAFLAMAMLLRPGIAADQFITAILALIWSWTGGDSGACPVVADRRHGSIPT